MNIDNPATNYLSSYLNSNDVIPEITLDAIFKAVKRI
jgi:hypothetical protein